MSSKMYILERIREKRNRCFKAPTLSMPKGYFEQVSCHNWAVNEILKEIEESMMPPMLVVEEFIKKMEVYACESKENSRRFSIAKDAGEWVLDILISLD